MSADEKDTYSRAEADRRRDELARHILGTPPQPRRAKQSAAMVSMERRSLTRAVASALLLAAK
jgi:hypothetical protein